MTPMATDGPMPTRRKYGKGDRAQLKKAMEFMEVVGAKKVWFEAIFHLRCPA